MAALAGHPPGRHVLFATELRERFSHDGMRALLALSPGLARRMHPAGVGRPGRHSP